MKIKKQPDLHQYTIKNSLSWVNDLLELHAEFPNYYDIAAAIEASLKTIESTFAMRAPRPLKRRAKNMQVHFVNVSVLTNLLLDSETMHLIDNEKQLIYVLRFGDGEVLSLAIANPTTGEATCSNPCASVEDADADGSINDQARLQRV
jgi:hypothetical protein